MSIPVRFYYLTITDCRTKIVFEKETIRGYLKSLWSYAIMPIGKTIESAHMAQQNPHEVRTRGVFMPFWVGGLNPRLLPVILVQPFADVVGNYTRQDRKYKR